MGMFRRWFDGAGSVMGVVLLGVVTVWDWVIHALPAWVAPTSTSILRRERARKRTT
jgi:hypothetical protein